MALADIIKALFGSKADRDYKAVKPLLNKILSSYEEIDKLSADELRAHQLFCCSVIEADSPLARAYARLDLDIVSRERLGYRERRLLSENAHQPHLCHNYTT